MNMQPGRRTGTRPGSASAPLVGANDADPREYQGAEIIDLATRHVLPAVARPPRRADALVPVAGMALVMLLGGLTFWNMSGTRVAHPVPTPSLAPAPIVPVAPLPARAIAYPLPASRPAFAPIHESSPLTAPQTNRLAAPTLVFDSGTLPSLEAGPQLLTAPMPGSAAAPGSGGDDFAARLGAGSSGAATATAALNPATTVAQGTLIPAVLETAIDTDVPGYVRAIVSSDVRSFDGSHMLVPRSSRLVGQYKSGLQAGQRRVYVIWTRLIRPDGVAVNIGSPATGFDGESGLSGNVSSHFFQRFGSAMLLTVMSGLTTLGSGGAGVVIAGGGQSAAAAAIGQTGQIGPTVRVHPGEPIRVFTARDLDFARVAAP